MVEFSEVITRVEQIIYIQKFEGATVNAFNANIISRELGLADKTVTEKLVNGEWVSHSTSEAEDAIESEYLCEQHYEE